MKKIFAAILGMTAAAALMASCAGNTESDDLSRSDAGNTTTVTTRATTETSKTTTRRTESSRDDSGFMSQAESKLDELGDDVADGIDTTLSTAGEVADDILR